MKCHFESCCIIRSTLVCAVVTGQSSCAINPQALGARRRVHVDHRSIRLVPASERAWAPGWEDADEEQSRRWAPSCVALLPASILVVARGRLRRTEFRKEVVLRAGEEQGKYKQESTQRWLNRVDQGEKVRADSECVEVIAGIETCRDRDRPVASARICHRGTRA